MRNPGWYLDELAYAGEEHLDSGYVTTYDTKSAHDPGDDVALLRSLGMDDTSVVVDLGAGTGTFALAVAPHCHRVVAVDVSPAMLTTLKNNVTALELTNVEVVHAGFLSYEHHGAPADFVYSRNALHHLPDFFKAIALKRIADMLGPGGVLRLHDLVFSFEPHEAAASIESWLARASARPEDGWTRPELETHVREEYSTFSWLLEPILEHCGFDIQQASHRNTYSAYVCVKRS